MELFPRLSEALDSLIEGDVYHGDLFVQSAVSHSLQFDDGALEEISSSAAEGLSFRLLQGENSLFAHFSGNDEATAFSAMGAVAERAERAFPARSLSREAILPPLPPITPPNADFLRQMDGLARRESPLVRQVSLRLSLSRKKILVFGPSGALSEDERSYGNFTVHVIVEKEGSLQTGHEVQAAQTEPDAFLRELRPEEVLLSALRRALLMLEASACPAGTMPVVLSGQAGGTMIHEACGHGLEADIIQKDFSVYRNSLGEIVASPLVTLVDDPTLVGHYGSYGYDDEGFRTERTTLIEGGVLKGFLTDIQTSRRGGLPRTGNGRRQSYRSLPQPRMSNTFILPGRDDPATLIDSVKKGLLVVKMGGGEVDPTTGNFVFQVTEGYLIEKGNVSKPVRGALLTGNGPEALRDIRAVGSDLHFEPGFCGKGGQSVPVTDGQPSLLIGGLVVGGSDT
ncbi:TldD/PmbA family protein [Aminithiophilus ramosus]|uniref:TldD/PmbA family protein n=2 Tax=Synergistales TaxID=649776 RepID=A0A9Q7AGB6_9BACT|nr:TldD/PmbA family protein [Aminithiophilus ramosus]QTX33569.1 TldD/PmbA family protein [Aminithiophilus ramosus]QVL37423.1 TldD/PmbA family protein [Synergistota bacterium]